MPPIDEVNVESGFENGAVEIEKNDISSKDQICGLLFRLHAKEHEAFAEAAALLDRCGIVVRHLETRPSRQAQGIDFLALHAQPPSADAISSLRASVLHVSEVRTSGGGNISSAPWFPRSFPDLDKTCACLVDVENDMKTIPPGWDDPKYMARRQEIEALALAYRHGQPLPHVEYRPEELATWKVVFERQTAKYASHACKEYNANLKLLMEKDVYTSDRIPQFEEVSAVLEACTGFTLRPVAGFLSPRSFLNCLAFRVFNATQYIRHHDHPFYTPEPDVLHDLMGHAPMFIDPEFAEFSQELGLASLGASDEDIERLSNVYWYTLEFGQCLEDGERKAYGAGLLSSNNELPLCLKDDVKTKPFDPEVAAVEPYIFNGFQHCYFVAESFKQATKSFKDFAKTVKRPFSFRYDPFTKTVKVLDSAAAISKVLDQTRAALGTAVEALQRL